MSDRKEGWYWVKQIDHLSDEYWEIGEWDGFVWMITGEEDQYESLPVVGDRIPSPGEAWQCVPVKWSPQMAFDMSVSIGRDEALNLWSVWPSVLAAAPKPEDT